ncbi:HNH endonuclease domain-containing protein [Mangrovibacterium marinum]|uniref:HNH endonuclease domain-containing protein n=1 Tax=Mangrovibacterium marinum TaxID=1639118 RepID=UPI002A1892D6|nr:HNH endonuclease domain-containing protein [Mangrovibacterium marinum]
MKEYVLTNISRIIERESKTSTYKFALLRAVIDLIQDNSPFIVVEGDRVIFPTGLLVEKWLLYYYPIFDSSLSIPQIGGETELAFGKQLLEFTDKYKLRGGFSAFYNDLKTRGIPVDLEDDFKALASKIKDTVTKMPMRYIGRSLSKEYYSIFRVEKRSEASKRINIIDAEYLINKLGSFSIPREYYDAFRVFGSFIAGKDSILFKWAEFSVRMSSDNLSVSQVLNDVLRSPVTEREVNESKKIFNNYLQEQGNVYCVWTGRKLRKYDLDHLIPFSVWKNNDLWNLLPSDSITNSRKRDKIPSAALIESQKELIIQYWDILNQFQHERFRKEIGVTLLGDTNFDSWETTAITQLKSTCDYLISQRGFDQWDGRN